MPFVCFGIMTFFTVTEKLKSVVSYVITGILIFVLGFAMLSALMFMSIELATTLKTDIGKYERVFIMNEAFGRPCVGAIIKRMNIAIIMVGIGRKNKNNKNCTFSFIK